jgi:hypothetical protein
MNRPGYADIANTGTMPGNDFRPNIDIIRRSA